MRMSARDTVAGTPPPDRPPHAPRPDDPTLTRPDASTPGPGRADRDPSVVSTGQVPAVEPAPDTDPEPQPGLPSIPGYQVLDILGRGGMGTVYRVRHLEMAREVALKLISPGGRDRETVRDRFTREVQALARIEH